MCETHFSFRNTFSTTLEEAIHLTISTSAQTPQVGAGIGGQLLFVLRRDYKHSLTKKFSFSLSRFVRPGGVKVHRQKKEGSDASIWPCDIGLGEGGLEGGGEAAFGGITVAVWFWD